MPGGRCQVSSTLTSALCYGGFTASPSQLCSRPGNMKIWHFQKTAVSTWLETVTEDGRAGGGRLPFRREAGFPSSAFTFRHACTHTCTQSCLCEVFKKTSINFLLLCMHLTLSLNYKSGLLFKMISSTTKFDNKIASTGTWCHQITTERHLVQLEKLGYQLRFCCAVQDPTYCPVPIAMMSNRDKKK